MNTLPLILAAGGWSAILTIAVFIILSLIGHFQQRSRNAADPRDPSPPPRPRDPRRSPRPGAPGPLGDWEETLRKLLEDSRAERPAPRRRQNPIPTPPPLASEEGPTFEMPPLTESRRAIEHGSRTAGQADAQVARASEHLGELPRAHEAMASAARIQSHAQEHLYQGILKDAMARPAGPTAGSLRAAEARVLVSRLRQPEGARQAVLASLIFAPPRSLQQD